MGRVVPLKAPPKQQEATSLVGMILFLASWAMMFGTLFFAYGYVRSHSPSWPPRGLPPFPLRAGAANTGVLLLSSGVYHYGLVSLRRARRGRFPRAMAAALLFGAAFLGGQVLLWRQLHAEGLPLRGAGTYGSVFYGLTGLHALHVIIGVVGLASVWWRAQRGVFTATRHAPVRLWGMYWHFMAAVWLLMYLTVFCL